MKKANVAVLIAKHAKSLDAGKKAYKHADACLDSIVAAMKPGDVVTAANGKKYKLFDEFSGKSIVWRPCGVRRYRLDEITEP